MEKREKIIVAATVVVALYGALDYLLLSSDSDDNTVLSGSGNSKMIAEITKNLAALDTQDNSLTHQLVKNINTPWPTEVFADISDKELLAPDEKQGPKMSSSKFKPGMFKYSGYVEMGSSKMAIINGSDHQVGDVIDGFTLSEITSEAIKVTWEGLVFEVPFKEPVKAGSVDFNKANQDINPN